MDHTATIKGGSSSSSGNHNNNGNNSPPPAFLFPVLKLSEIVQCLEELEIEISKAELAEPVRHRDRLRQMWFQLLEVCTGQTEEDLKQLTPNVAAVGDDEDDSLHGLDNNKNDIVYQDFQASHGGFGDVILYRAMRRLMEIAGYDQFSMRDLYSPDSKRVKHQLSAMINMAKHREEQIRFYNELIEPRAELIVALEEVNEEHKVLQSQLTEVKKSAEAKSSELHVINDECNELELEIGRANRTQATLRLEAKELKKQLTEVNDELTAANWTLEELQTEEETLRAQVVSSPDRRLKEADEWRTRVQEEKKENAAIEEQIHQCKLSIRQVQKLEKDLLTTTGMLGDLHQSATKYMNIVQSIDDIAAVLTEFEKRLGQIEEETQQIQRRIQRSEEEIVAQRKQHALELEAVQESLDSFKSQLLLVEKDRREGMLRVQQGEAEVQAFQQAMEAERVQTQREIADLVAAYKKAEQRFMERDRNRRRVLGMTPTAGSKPQNVVKG